MIAECFDAIEPLLGTKTAVPSGFRTRRVRTGWKMRMAPRSNKRVVDKARLG